MTSWRKKKRKKRPRPDRPLLYVGQILNWADEYHRQKGRWPTLKSGRIEGTLDEKWENVDNCLRIGARGLRAGSSLARLLAAYRGYRNQQALPDFTINKILRWADAHYRRAGQWPKRDSGPIIEAPGETWTAVNVALSKGRRGLPGSSSLARLLEACRGVRNVQNTPRLTIRKILAWADAHYRRTGRWPNPRSGPIQDAPGETWHAVESALRTGKRGLLGGSSLARVFAEHRGVRNTQDLQKLSNRQILAWADAHYRRTGRWPKRDSGPILDAPGETWSAVASALGRGRRGLRPGLSLAGLLDKHRGVRNARTRPLTIKKILAWADAYYRRTGRWPHAHSGPIAEGAGETWSGIYQALRNGFRGLPRAGLAEILRKGF